MKRKKYVKRRHNFFVKLARFLLGWFLKLKIGYRAKRVRLAQSYKPYLFISNHVGAFDPILTSLTMGEQIYYLSSEHIFSKGFSSRLLEYTFAPVPKSKSQIDFVAIKRMIEISREGGNIGIFIEGNSTMTGKESSVPAAIGKLALLLKQPIVIFNFDLGYLKNPRWSIKKRRGTYHGGIKEVLAYDDYKHMDQETLSNYLIDAISVNAYEVNEKLGQEFVGKDKALGLERLVFTCPKCHSVNASKTSGDTYICTKCDFVMHYDNKAYSHSAFFKAPQTTIELDHNNKLAYQQLIIADEAFNIRAHARFIDLYQRRRRKRGIVNVTFSRRGLELQFTKRRADIFYAFDEINMITMAQKENVIIYLNNGETKLIQLTKHTAASAYQFVVTFQIFTNTLKFEQANKKVIPLPHTALGL